MRGAELLGVEGFEQLLAGSPRRRLMSSISAIGLPASSALTMARALVPWTSAVTTFRRIPASTITLCRRFF